MPATPIHPWFSALCRSASWLLVLLAWAAAQAQDTSGWDLAFSDDFERAEVGPNWQGTGFYDIEDGALVLGREGDPGQNLIMCRQRFPHAVRIEYDARTSADTPCDLSALISAGDGVSSGIFFGVGSMNNTVTRLLDRGEVVETADRSIEPGRTYRISLERDGAHVTCALDETVLFSHMLDDIPNGPGHDRVGLYVWATAVIDNVKVYTKHEPIVSTEKEARDLVVAPRAYPKPGKVVISVDLPGKTIVREDTLLEVSLKRPWRWRPFAEQRLEVSPGSREEIVFDAHAWEPGTLNVTAVLRNPHGDKRLDPVKARLEWPGRDKAFSGIRVLNNFVWELLRVANRPPVDGRLEYDFYLPVDRWVLVKSSCTAPVGGHVRLGFDDNVTPVIAESATRGSTTERMRRLTAGRHTLWVDQLGGGIFHGCIVRAVPSVQHSRYPSRTQGIPDGYDYDWSFFERHIAPHVNTIITSNVSEADVDRLREWKRTTGGKLIVYTGRPGLHGKPELEKSPEALLNYLTARLQGYAHNAILDGLLMDEFYRENDPAIPVYTAMVRDLRRTRDFSSISFNPYAAGAFGKDAQYAAFADACIAGGGNICWEGYVPEYPGKQQAMDALARYPGRHLLPMETERPGITHHTVWVLGTFSFPWPFADGYPDVDFNAWIDLQFQWLATHPAFFGLGGVHLWRTGYMHEESVRLAAACFRHYCLEGHTDRLLDRPYLLTHVSNPDFTEGFDSWTTAPAEADTLQALSYPDFGKLQGRYYQGNDTFAVFERRENRPNLISQEVNGLTPGQLYSLKLFTGDFGDLEAGRSRRATHGLTATLDGVEPLSGPDLRYQKPFPTRARMLGFSRQHPLWLNLHWQVFRARSRTATLSISDWRNGSPAGPRGQKLLVNFVELKPYTRR